MSNRYYTIYITFDTYMGVSFDNNNPLPWWDWWNEAITLPTETSAYILQELGYFDEEFNSVYEKNIEISEITTRLLNLFDKKGYNCINIVKTYSDEKKVSLLISFEFESMR